MSPAIKRIILCCLVFFFMIGCVKPGYLIRIETHKADISLVSKIKDVVISHNFRTITEGRETHTNDNVYEYWKVLFGEKYDFIYIQILSGKPRADSYVHMRMEISNDVKGIIPSIKQHIDEMGNTFYDEISKSVGVNNVSIERKAVARRWLY